MLFSKKTIHNLLLFIVLVVLSSSFIVPQLSSNKDSGVLEVRGKIKNEKNESLDSVLISIKDSTGKKVIQELYTNKKGRFKFSLTYQKKVNTYFKKDGFVTMFCTFDTKTPKSKSHKVLFYEASISLPQINSSYNKKVAQSTPFMKVAYDKSYSVFVEDLDYSIDFLDKITEPNVGSLLLSGKIQDATTDSISVKTTALDSLGFVLAESQTDIKGNYSIGVPLMNKAKLVFESDQHHTSFANIESTVNEDTKDNSFSLEHDFILIPKTKKITKDLAEQPIDKIFFDQTKNDFNTDVIVRKKFLTTVDIANQAVMVSCLLTDTSDKNVYPINIEVVLNDKTYAKYKVNTPQYSFDVPYQSNVDLNLKSKGYYPLSMKINTNMEADEMDKASTIIIPIDMYQKNEEGINSDAFDMPIKNFYFDKKTQAFVMDTIASEAFASLLFPNGKANPDTSEIANTDTVNLAENAKQITQEVDSTETNKTPYIVVQENTDTVNLAENAKQITQEVDSTETNKTPHIVVQENTDTVNLAENNNTEAIETIVEKEASGLLFFVSTVYDPSTKDEVPNTLVNVLDKNKNIESSFITDKKGKFTAQLSLNKIYYIELEKDDYYTSTFQVNTNVPEGKENTDITQREINAPIVHIEDKLKGNNVPKVVMENRLLTAYSYDKEKSLFVENDSIFDHFMEEIAAFNAGNPIEQRNTVPEVKPVKSIMVSGVVKDIDQNPLSKATIEVLVNGKVYSSAKSNKTGEYVVGIPIDSQAVVEFSAKKHYDTKYNFDTKVEDKDAFRDKKFKIPYVTLYKTSNLDANPLAFKNAVKEFSMNEDKLTLKTNPAIEKEFYKTLAIIPDNQKLKITGSTENTKGKPVGFALINVFNGAQLIDSIRSNAKGDFELLLPYQKEYRLVVKGNDLFGTYSAISTKTTNSNERLIDQKIKGLDLLIVNKKEDLINPMAFLKPFSRVKFNADKNEFIEVDDVEELFMADLYLPPPPVEKKRVKDVDLDIENVAVTVFIASPILDEDLRPATNSAAKARQEKKRMNKSLAEKNEVMSNLRSMMMGIQTKKPISMQNIDLNIKRITKTGKYTADLPKENIDTNLSKAIETRQLLSKIVAEALGFRKNNIPPVSTDSTYSLKLDFRTKHLTEGFGIYVVDRDEVFEQNKITEFVKETNWLFFESFYKNGEEISELQYNEELSAYIKNNNQTELTN